MKNEDNLGNKKKTITTINTEQNKTKQNKNKRKKRK